MLITGLLSITELLIITGLLCEGVEVMSGIIEDLVDSGMASEDSICTLVV